MGSEEAWSPEKSQDEDFVKMALGSQFWEKWIGERELLKEGDAGVVDSEEKILGRVGGGAVGRGSPEWREIQAKRGGRGCKVKALMRGIWEWAYCEHSGRRRQKGRKFW